MKSFQGYPSFFFKIVLVGFLAIGSPAQAARIHEAAANGDLATVKTIVQKHPDMVDDIDATGATPLLLAAGNNHKDVVEFLLANHADVNLKKANKFQDETPIFIAVWRGHKEVVQVLLDHKADLTIKSLFTRPVHQSMNHTELLAMLLDHGADVNDRDDHTGDTLLHEAIRYLQYDFVKILLERKADVNARNKAGQTPLHSAAMGMIVYGGPPKDHNGCGGFTNLIKLLLEYHADVTVKDNEGVTPLAMAHRYQHAEFYNYLQVPVAGK